MVNLKIKDIKSMNRGELENKLVELRKEMMKDNTQITTGTVPKSPGQVRMNKRIIARILTVLSSKKEFKKADKKEPAPKMEAPELVEKSAKKEPAKKESTEKVEKK